MKIVKADKEGIAEAVKYLRAGKAVVYPTDTAYGLGVDAANARAAQRLYRIKGRAYKKPTHVIVHDFSAAKKYVTANRVAEKLVKKFWPGALTIVLQLRVRPLPASGHPPQAWGGVGGEVALRILSAGTGTIGIRVPNSKIALALAKKLGRPITATSANPAGGPTPYSIRESSRQFAGKKYQPDLYLDAGKLPRRRVSTLVQVENGIIKILRDGAVTKRQIQNALFLPKS